MEKNIGVFSPYRYSIVFIDVEDTNRGLGALAASLFVIGVAAVGVILLISLLVANRAIRPVEESIARQRRFVADASHELKTPIAVIAANAEAAADGYRNMDVEATSGAESAIVSADGDKDAAAADPQLARWIGNIADEANRMNTLVESLLALARAEEKKADRAPFDLVSAVCEESDRVEVFLFEKGVGFGFEQQTPKDEPLIVVSDRTKVRAILSILFENAVKYTPDGGRVTVTVGKTYKNGSAKNPARPFVSVSNTGAYISQDDIAHIFDRFYRADPSRSSETGGHGIGLSIAKEIAGSVAGDLTAMSAPCADGGATNTFTLFL